MPRTELEGSEAIPPKAVIGSDLDDNIDMGSRGFNSDQVDGCDVNDGAAASPSILWTSEKISQYVVGEILNGQIEAQPIEFMGFGEGSYTAFLYPTRNCITAAMYGKNDDGQMVVQEVIPPDYAGFVSNGFRIRTLRWNSLSYFTVTLSNNGTPDPNINEVSVMPSAHDTFEDFYFTPAGSYSQGDLVLIDVKAGLVDKSYAEVAVVAIEHERV